MNFVNKIHRFLIISRVEITINGSFAQKYFLS